MHAESLQDNDIVEVMPSVSDCIPLISFAPVVIDERGYTFRSRSVSL